MSQPSPLFLSPYDKSSILFYNQGEERTNKTQPKKQLDLSSIKDYDQFIKRNIGARLASRTQDVRDLVYDEVIDALLKAIEEKRAKVTYGDASIKGYIYGIIRNKCNDCFREITRSEKRLLKQPIIKIINPEDDQYDSLYKKSISDANATPPTEDELRILFMKLDLERKLSSGNLQIAMKLIWGENRGTISEDLGLTIDQARGRIARVREKLNDPSIKQALEKRIKKQKYRPRKRRKMLGTRLNP